MASPRACGATPFLRKRVNRSAHLYRGIAIEGGDKGDHHTAALAVHPPGASRRPPSFRRRCFSSPFQRKAERSERARSAMRGMALDLHTATGALIAGNGL